MRADVRCKVIRARERAHTDMTMERLLTSMYANMASQFIRSGESAITGFNRAFVRPLMYGSFAGSVGIFSGFHG